MTSTPALWYLTRSTGLVAFVLLTASMVLGVLTVRRAGGPAWPRFATQALHQRIVLLALGFIGVHVLTTVLDSFVSVPWWTVVVPFGSSYRPLYVGLGTVAFDLLLVLVITSLGRAGLGHRFWRGLHWLAYAVWPLALIHYVGGGTDIGNRWGLGLAFVAIGVVALSAAGRFAMEKDEQTRPIGERR